MGSQPLRVRRRIGLFIWILALVAFGSFAYPMYVIRPFRSQGQTELAIALAVKQAAPWLTIFCAGLAALCSGIHWRQWRLPGRIGAIAATLVACGSIYLAYFNIYEIMFHPMGPPAAEPAHTAKVDSDDMVIAVRVNGSARAYPIRTMGYHHVANDWVGGVPLVATY